MARQNRTATHGSATECWGTHGPAMEWQDRTGGRSMAEYGGAAPSEALAGSGCVGLARVGQRRIATAGVERSGRDGIAQRSKSLRVNAMAGTERTERHGKANRREAVPRIGRIGMRSRGRGRCA